MAGLLLCVCFDDSAVEMAFTQTSPTQQMSTVGICLFWGQNSQHTVGEVERRHWSNSQGNNGVTPRCSERDTHSSRWKRSSCGEGREQAASANMELGLSRSAACTAENKRTLTIHKNTKQFPHPAFLIPMNIVKTTLFLHKSLLTTTSCQTSPSTSPLPSKSQPKFHWQSSIYRHPCWPRRKERRPCLHGTKSSWWTPGSWKASMVRVVD